MFQYDEEEDVTVCVNCDAEYTITKIDEEEQEAEFCPFCGYHHLEEDYEEEDDIDESDTLQ
jgi:Zn ribbon nucleic-acid-binding protein